MAIITSIQIHTDLSWVFIRTSSENRVTAAKKIQGARKRVKRNAEDCAGRGTRGAAPAFQRGKRAGRKAAPPVSFDSTGRRRCPKSVARTACYFTVTVTEAEGIPFATTTMVLGPSSMVAGTSKWVVTLRAPVATPMLVWLWVRQ